MRNFFFSHSSNLILYNLITPDANKNNNVHASKCLEGTRAIWSDCYIKDATEASIQKCVDVTRECLRIRSLMTTKPEIWLGVTPRYFITEENQHTLGHRMIHTDVLREALARCLSTTDETGFSPSAVIVWSGDYWYYGKEAGDNWAQAARNRVHALESQHYELPYIPGDRDAMFQFINTTDLQMLKNIRTALTPERP